MIQVCLAVKLGGVVLHQGTLGLALPVGGILQQINATGDLGSRVKHPSCGICLATSGQPQYRIGIQVDQPVLQRQVRLGQAELALTAAPAIELQGDAAGVVHLGADNAQAQGKFDPCNAVVPAIISCRGDAKDTPARQPGDHQV